MDIVKLAINNARLTIAVLVFLLLAGWVAYQSTPKEAEPDVPTPYVYINVAYQGIAPEDAERLLLRPLEAKLKSLKGLKEMKSSAYQGGAFVFLEFLPSIKVDTAVTDTRSKVQDAKADLPQAAEEPVVTEVNISEFPVLVVTLSGDVPERVLTAAARELRDRIEEVPGVLEGTIQGARDDLVEVVIDPMKLSSYGLQLDQLIGAVGASNSLVAAGNIEGSEGKYAVKVPSLIETPEDVASLPVVAGPNAVVQAKDIATVRSTFADAETITRLNGKPAIAIEVKKRIGANLIDTLAKVREVSDAYVKTMPEGMNITYTQDKSVFVNQLLGDLQNHVMIAVILVFIVILYALSGRASLLIGLAIPSSFLIGILLLAMMGYTINMIVLFSLILAVGMLVDDAIIVTEFAERRMGEGMPKAEAFTLAAKRMAGPVIAATMTRIAAFSPLLFWPGIIGDFMKYMPITLIVTLSASMLYALVFAPTLGALFAKAPEHHEEHNRDGWYMALVKQAVRFPITVLVLTAVLLTGVGFAYSKYGAGVEFFPSVEPDYGLLYVHARGNLSLAEMDTATRIAENRLLGWPGVKSVYTRVGKTQGGGQDVPEDVVGVIQYEFIDWRERKSANNILDELRTVMAGIPGVDVEVRVPEAGPPTGKAVQLRLSAIDPKGLDDQARAVAARIAKVPGVIDVSDGLPPPGVDWALEVDRAKAAQYGISPTAVGTVVQLVTNGLKLSEYRPAGADDAVDIRLRLPEDRRTLSTLDELRVQTAQGSVPISNFVVRKPEPTVGILNRIDGARTVVVQANVAAGNQVAAVQAEVTKAVTDMKLDNGIRWKLAGSNEDSAEASAFLGKAFGAAIFLIFLVLLMQFNKFTSVLLVLSCVVMATIGVFLGLLLTGEAFGIVMSGIGVIALAGVVVNNNIVLIDTYDRLREEGWDKMEAVLQTCRERARPVVLTAVSAILGVLPIAFGLGLEIFHHETTINAPSTQWWISLSSAIVFGLSFATLLTLVVTPSMLMIFTRSKNSRFYAFFRRLFGRDKKRDASTGPKPGPLDEPAIAFPKAAE
ncbi:MULTISPECIES: efflux RND transporter permease subunit [unclassified Mesorhizobium]|uniref:efflux RND transporter permease subunit n=1 Tax=unclassified Mesorhizobium TaxID=325217 RepID=UPI0003CF13A1|nr:MULTISPECIES: efflux RND transporter permease subunit [unclassified Mesorhizobium]ESY16779.1 acriflavin resistance protein [Mesorhizobium sp. LNJC394B00]ESZ00214.1 acriflavin resistance protein [Mesorhizobium sp. L2C089B000]ESZ53749.1 acriflavin resistance protein [Mesorhizobium sp. L103C131B0]WJI48930.1 efflux RND transporter permease subunit [Mesorhizobium sp. C089B]